MLDGDLRPQQRKCHFSWRVWVMAHCELEQQNRKLVGKCGCNDVLHKTYFILGEYDSSNAEHILLQNRNE